METQRIPLVWLGRRLSKIRWAHNARRLPALAWGLAITLATVLALVLVPANFEIAAEGQLLPSARWEIFAPADGVIEAIESTDPNWFCVGVQWHPECDTASALDMQIFECFVQAAVRNSDGVLSAA